MASYLLEGIDLGRVQRHVAWFTGHASGRISGTADMERAAAYVCGELREYGLEPLRRRFRAYTSIPGPAALEVGGKAPSRIKAVSVAFTRELGEGEATWVDLVDGGAGEDGDYRGRDVRGKALLVEAHGSATPERARLAAARGAAALVLATWPAPVPDVVTFRAMKGVWGLPGPETLREIPDIVALCVSHDDARRLRVMISENGGALPVRVSATATTGWMPLEEVTVRIVAPGPEGDDFVLVHGHLDAWCPGVTDNASGNALMLELARLLGRCGGNMRRSVVLAFWDGHEIAEATGSSYFVARNWDLLRDHCVAQVNVDSPGVRGTRRFLAASSPELEAFQRLVHATIGAPARYLSPGRTADQSFLMAGVPGLLCFPDGEPEGEVPFFWWSHTGEDTLDKFSPEAFLAQARVIVHYLDGLLRSTAWPMDFAPMLRSAARVIDRIVVQSARVPMRGLPGEEAVAVLAEALADARRVLGEVAVLYRRARRVAREASRGREWLYREHNRLARDLSRILLPVLGTVGGRYHQDRYADPRYTQRLPGLSHLRAVGDAAGEEALLSLGPALMERNRLTDALLAARERLRVHLQS